MFPCFLNYKEPLDSSEYRLHLLFSVVLSLKSAINIQSCPEEGNKIRRKSDILKLDAALLTLLSQVLAYDCHYDKYSSACAQKEVHKMQDGNVVIITHWLTF